MTSLGSAAERTAEAAWLAALAATPVFFNVYSNRIFEGDKAALVRALAVVVGAAMLVRGVAAGGGPGWLRTPLVRPALGVLAAQALATLASLAPARSLWGSYVRAQGLLTTGAYLAFFLAIVLLARRRAQRERIVTATVLGAVPVAAYALVQRAGLDPIPWRTEDLAGRVTSALGNPIFLAGFLAMVIPLALACLVAALAERARGRAAAGASAVCAGLTLALALAAFAFCASRGPWLGLIAGLGLFGLLALRTHGRRGGRALGGILVGAALAAIVAGLLAAAGARSAAPVAESFRREADTVRVRLLVWSAMVKLAAPHAPLWSPLTGPDRLGAWRPLIGHGPETIALVYQSAWEPELAHADPPGRYADRAHNETLDVLVETGVLGLPAHLVLVTAIVRLGLGRLGLLDSRRAHALCAGGWFGGALAGSLAARTIDGTWRLAGAAGPAGALVGLVVALVALGRGRRVDPSADAPWLTIGLLTAIVAHWVEIQFGIAVTATRLLFWALVALLAVIDEPGGHAPAEAGEESSRDPDDPVTPYVPILALVLATATYGLVTNPTAAGQRTAAGAVLLATLAVGAGAIAAGAGPATGGWRRAALATGASAAGFALFLTVHLPALDPGADPARLPGLYALAVLATLVSTAMLLERRPVGVRARSRAGPWIAAGAVVVAAGAATGIPLRDMEADVHFRRARLLVEMGRLEAAVPLYEATLRLAPREDAYYPALASALAALAPRIGVQASVEEPERAARLRRRALLLARAERLLERARELAPLDASHVLALARLVEVRAALAPADPERRAHVERELALLDQAARMMPTAPRVHNEWARVAALAGRLDAAIARYERSAAIDPRLAQTHLGLRDLYRVRAALASSPEAARADSARAAESERRARALGGAR